MLGYPLGAGPASLLTGLRGGRLGNPDHLNARGPFHLPFPNDRQIAGCPDCSKGQGMGHLGGMPTPLLLRSGCA